MNETLFRAVTDALSCETLLVRLVMDAFTVALGVTLFRVVKDVFNSVSRLERLTKEVFTTDWFDATFAKEAFTRAFVEEMDAFSRDKDAFKVVIKEADA